MLKMGSLFPLANSSSSLEVVKAAAQEPQTSIICRIFKIIYEILRRPLQFFMPKKPPLRLAKPFPPESYLEFARKFIQNHYGKIAMTALACGGGTYWAFMLRESQESGYSLVSKLAMIGVPVIGVYGLREWSKASVKCKQQITEMMASLEKLEEKMQKRVELFPLGLSKEKIPNIYSESSSFGAQAQNLVQQVDDIHIVLGLEALAQKIKSKAKEIRSILIWFEFPDNVFSVGLMGSTQFCQQSFPPVGDKLMQIRKNIIKSLVDTKCLMSENEALKNGWSSNFTPIQQKHIAYYDRISEELKPFVHNPDARGQDLEELGEKRLLYFKTAFEKLVPQFSVVQELLDQLEDFRGSYCFVNRVSRMFCFENGISYSVDNVECVHKDLLALLQCFVNKPIPITPQSTIASEVQ